MLSRPDRAGPRASRPGKRTRWRLTDADRAVLEWMWAEHGTKPPATEVASAAAVLGQSVRRVRVWFQNRRQRRTTAERTDVDVAMLWLVNVCSFFPTFDAATCLSLADEALRDRTRADAIVRAAAMSQTLLDCVGEGTSVDVAWGRLWERARDLVPQLPGRVRRESAAESV